MLWEHARREIARERDAAEADEGQADGDHDLHGGER